jgi:hypothetical protein
MFIFLKSTGTQKDGHCEHLKLFIAFVQPVVKNFKKLICKKVLFFVHHHNLIPAYQMEKFGTHNTHPLYHYKQA